MKPATLLSKALVPAATVGLLLSLTGPAAAADPEQITRGAKAWAENCGRCHNIRTPNELAPEEWMVSVTHMRVRARIPGNVTDDIIAFLQASSGGIGTSPGARPAYRPVALGPGSPARGQQVYMEICVVCHGPDGRGAVEGVPQLAPRLGQPDDVLLGRIINGYQSPGSQLAMPPRGGNPDLTDQALADVLAYMHQEFGG